MASLVTRSDIDLKDYAAALDGLVTRRIAIVSDCWFVLPMILPRIERIRWSEPRLGQLVELLDRFHRADRGQSDQAERGDQAPQPDSPTGPS